MGMGATEAIARFALELDGRRLPEPVRRAARRAILDCIGVALAGSREVAGQIMAELVVAQGGEPESVVWGTAHRVTAQSAALANGTAAHALDFDDTNISMPGHPSVPVLPALLAVGERIGAAGSALVEAFVVGVEAECKLGRFSGQDAFDRGWHTTTTLGVVGATVAIGRLVGLELPQLRQAIGLAVAQAGGVRQNFGTMTKPFHVGRAAQAAVLAVELVQRGFTASQTAIEGRFGYWDLYAGCGDRSEDLAGSLGQPFDLTEPGISFKAYPCCASAHAAIDAALSIDEALDPNRIARVLVDVPYTAPLVLIHHRPTTPLAAKFSLEYCVATALLHRHVGLQHFAETAINEDGVQTLLRRVDYRVPDPWQKGAGPWRLDHARVVVQLDDGRELTGETTTIKGDPANPLSDAELETKFLDCAELALGPAAARRALGRIGELETLPDVALLSAALVRSTPAT